MGVIICLEVFFIVETFFSLGVDKRSLKGLPVFLLDHDFRSRVHLFMTLIKLFVFMQHNTMLVGNGKHLLDTSGDLLLILRLFL